MIKLLMVGLLSAGLGLFWNGLWFNWNCKEQVRVGWVIPFGEETFKLILAGIFSVSFFGINVSFGFWEGLYEVMAGQFKNNLVINVKHFGVTIITHILIGIVYFLPFPLWTRFLSAITLHIVWNQTILRNNYQPQGKKD